jgi:hypothetical protein
MRDLKRSTVISIQYSKNGKHFVLTDINGEQSIIDKNDKDALHEAILEIADNKELPEFNLSIVTVGQNETKGKTTAPEGLNLQDLSSNPTATLLGAGLGLLQNLSKYPR